MVCPCSLCRFFQCTKIRRLLETCIDTISHTLPLHRTMHIGNDALPFAIVLASLWLMTGQSEGKHRSTPFFAIVLAWL